MLPDHSPKVGKAAVVLPCELEEVGKGHDNEPCSVRHFTHGVIGFRSSASLRSNGSGCWAGMIALSAISCGTGFPGSAQAKSKQLSIITALVRIIVTPDMRGHLGVGRVPLLFPFERLLVLSVQVTAPSVIPRRYRFLHGALDSALCGLAVPSCA